jgi:CBS domain-containing protein
METGYKVIDAMTVRPITADPEMMLRDVAKLMRDKGIGSLLLKKDEDLIGIVTEWDIVRRGMALALDADKTPASKVMTPTDKMAIADPGMDIFEALKLMREHDVRHLPVIHENKLAGFITLKDVLKLQPQLFELIAEKYEIREAERKPMLRDDVSGECDVCKNYSEKIRDVRGVNVCPDCVNDVDE